MTSLKALSVLNDCTENERMTDKLPEWMRIKWARIAAKTGLKEGRHPTFREFSEFIKEEACIMMLPMSQPVNNRNQERDNKGAKPTAMSYLTSTNQDRGCLCCTPMDYSTADCYRLQKKSKKEKDEFMRKHSLC